MNDKLVSFTFQPFGSGSNTAEIHIAQDGYVWWRWEHGGEWKKWLDWDNTGKEQQKAVDVRDYGFVASFTEYQKTVNHPVDIY